MHPEPGFFEAFYAGPIQHPLLLWLAAAVCTVLGLARRGLDPSLRRYVAVLGVLSLLDAWLTSNRVFGMQGPVSALVPLFFVLAGDLRYWLLVTCADAAGGIRFRVRGVAVAAGLTAIVPVFSQLVILALPESVASARVLFLVYEVAFAALTLALLARWPSLRTTPWLRRVSRFVVLYYALWAFSDVLILVGLDAGFALRVVPNLLYYGGLIAVIAFAAPAHRER